MRNRTRRRLLIGCLAALWAAALWAAALVLPAGAEPATTDRVADWVRQVAAASGIPGHATTVVSADEVLLHNGYGQTGSGRPVTADTPFVIGSTSKSFTALAIMQLVDASRVDLDTPVRHYVPEFEMADAAASGITVREVLNQTSGIPGTVGGPVLKSASDGTAEEAIAELRTTRLAGPPGSRFRYANANYVLAGLVVERTSGEPYGAYVERHIFAPLGMSHSHTTQADGLVDGMAVGHRFWFGVPVASGPTVRPGLLAAGFLISSSADLGRYLAMYLNDGVAANGTRIVSSDGLRTMLSPGPEATLGPWADHASSRYAMGWFVGGPWSEPALLHPGNAPDSSAMIVLLPERGWAVAGLMNATNELPLAPSVTDRLNRNVVDILLDEPPTAAGSLRSFYLVVDLVAASLLAGFGYLAYRAVRGAREPVIRHRRLALVTVGVLVAVAAALLLVPPAAGYGWRAAWTWMPDLTMTVALLAGLSVVAATGRLVAVTRSSPGAPTTPTARQPGEDGRPFSSTGPGDHGATKRALAGSRARPGSDRAPRTARV